MKAKVKLQSVIDALQMMLDDQRAFYNMKTGEIVIISFDELRAAEEGKPADQFPVWQQESIKAAIRILEEDFWLPLPAKHDINEYAMMERFCSSLGNPELRQTMISLIRGSGAFRRFKDYIGRYNLEQDWYRFKDNALRDIAAEWCRNNEISFE